jgi:hypothetical protein
LVCLKAKKSIQKSNFDVFPICVFAKESIDFKLVEGPNNVLPWFADFIFQIYFDKLTSKFGKIGLLDDPGGQGSSPKDFLCRLSLSNGLGLRPRKEKSRV